jgi:hypothetical protein
MAISRRGVHVATLDEVIARFGHGSEQREAQAQSLQWLMPLCARAGVERVLINGSFVTDHEEPNDVDCVLLQGPTYRSRSRDAVLLRRGLPFVELRIVKRDEYDFFANTFFASDRNMVTKGIVEVVL